MVLMFVMLSASACGKPQQAAAPTVVEKEPIGVLFVAVPEISVRSAPDETAEVVSTRRAGEAVSILMEKDPWVEVRLGNGGTGWMPKESLTANRDDTVSTASTVRFLRRPSPVFNTSKITGLIMLECQVSRTGEVTNVRTMINTTGSTDLEMRNHEEIKRARFAPMMVAGQAKAFVYEYRIQY